MGEPWLVRVEDEQGEVHGAGTLLDEMFVLTCAHVVGALGSVVHLHVRGRPDKPYLAKVVTWEAPDFEHHQGDVAVLELAEPVTGAPRARLRRNWSRNETVYCFGFRAGVEETGIHASGVLQSHDMSEERVQLSALSPGPRITEGFSGAAALNAAGDVYGVIVSVDRGGHDASWMIDVSALLQYAGPMVTPYLAVDEPTRDRQFTDPSSQGGAARSYVHVALEQALADWLRSDDVGGVVVVCGTAAMAVVSRLVGLTVSAYRARVSAAERSSGLPVGSVDAAVDAAGKTAEDVATAIVRALGLRTDDGRGLLQALDDLGPPVTVVVNSVDAADDPLELCDRVLRPVAIRAPLLRVRLVLGFADEPPGDLADAVVIAL